MELTLAEWGMMSLAIPVAAVIITAIFGISKLYDKIRQ